MPTMKEDQTWSFIVGLFSSDAIELRSGHPLFFIDPENGESPTSIGTT